MTRYAPHKWLLIEVKSPTPHFRVFGTWTGSYTEGDSWRLNSGVSGVVDRDDSFEIVGGSGSVYEIQKSSYGATAYCASVAQGFVKKHVWLYGEDTARILDEAEALKILEDWTDA